MGFRRNTNNVKQEQPKQQQKQVEKSTGSRTGGGKQAKKTSGGGSNTFIKIGTLMQTKDGNKQFLSLIDPNEDQYAKFQDIFIVDSEGNERKVVGISSRTVEEELQGLVDGGHITEEEAEERLNKVPSTVIGPVSFIVE